MGKRPRIGITMRLELPTRRFYLGRDYSEALAGVGAIPVHLALIPDREYIEGAIDGLDGILLPGSDSDVDPKYFNDDPHPKLKNVVPEKDETDMLVLEASERAGLPVMAICYGMQVLNVWRGGTLIQDIDSLIEGSIKHDQGLPLERNSHIIEIEKDSFLGRMEASGSAGHRISVNSHHHQAIGALGDGIKPVAWANDGVVECIEDVSDKNFVLGVQWHPELSWEKDDFSNEIFTSFVKQCSGR